MYSSSGINVCCGHSQMLKTDLESILITPASFPTDCNGQAAVLAGLHGNRPRNVPIVVNLLSK